MSILVFFLLDLGLILVTFGTLRTGLNFNDFPWPLGCGPEFKARAKWMVGSWLLGPSTKPVRQHYSRQHVETVWQQAALRIQKKTGKFHMSRSLVPSKEGAGGLLIIIR